MRVLVTGFGPFLEHEANPSSVLARALDGRRCGRGLVISAHAPLPVVYLRAFEQTMARVRALRAGVVIAIGLAAQSSVVRIERRATNEWTSASPDARGFVPARSALVPGAPRYLHTPLDPAPLLRALGAEGIECTLSHHAGGYVCNDLYYRLLHARVPSIFVHVPPGDTKRAAGPLATAIARVVASGR